MNNIHIESDLLQSPGALIQKISSICPYKNIAIIADTQVANLYGNTLLETFLLNNFNAHIFTFPPGESSKSRETKAHLEDRLLGNNLGSDTTLIALGGGVTTDLAGFIAATYCRGIPLISMPTTLLAMCDAALGGKNGVNTPFGKNMIGTLYEPKKIFIDPDTLKTLPTNNLKEGLVEVIKHAIIVDPALFTYLETHSQEILTLQPTTLHHLISESCRIKLAIVHDSNKSKRNLLNFGHTVGHALESLSNYTLSHGHAVALGMLAESQIALLLNIMSQATFDRIQNLLHLYDLPLTLPSFPIDTLLHTMTLDKKSLNSTPRFVLPSAIGHCLPCEGHFCAPIDTPIIRQALDMSFT